MNWTDSKPTQTESFYFYRDPDHHIGPTVVFVRLNPDSPASLPDPLDRAYFAADATGTPLAELPGEFSVNPIALPE